MNANSPNTFASEAIQYFNNLKLPSQHPEDVEFMNPYSNLAVRKIISEFFTKYFNDSNKRVYIMGINPGRFGGGLTGISFTDPVALRKYCKIENNLGNRKELSSEFVYKVINKFGGARKFYAKYFLSALYPLALIKNGKNYNYYDGKELWNFMEPLIVESINEQLKFGAERKYAISLGKKNAKYLIKINNEHNFFDEIKILDHPRFIMQYRRKKLDEYINEYLSALKD